MLLLSIIAHSIDLLFLHRKDVTFDEDSAYNKSRKRPAKEPEEAEARKIHDTQMNEET